MNNSENIIDRLYDNTDNELISSQKNKSIERFQSLSDKNKIKVIEEVNTIIKKYHKIEVQENNERICDEQGHTFGEWIKKEWTTKEVYWDAGPQGYIDVKHKRWDRVCNRCGFIDSVKTEPESVKFAREKEEKKAKIKKLRRELRDLEKEQ